MVEAGGFGRTEEREIGLDLLVWTVAGGLTGCVRATTARSTHLQNTYPVVHSYSYIAYLYDTLHLANEHVHTSLRVTLGPATRALEVCTSIVMCGVQETQTERANIYRRGVFAVVGSVFFCWCAPPVATLVGSCAQGPLPFHAHAQARAF